jgi:hypothetical protein
MNWACALSMITRRQQEPVQQGGVTGHFPADRDTGYAQAQGRSAAPACLLHDNGETMGRPRSWVCTPLPSRARVLLTPLRGSFPCPKPSCHHFCPADPPLKMVLARLDVLNEDARVKLDIGVTDEESIARGATLLALPGAIVSAAEDPHTGGARGLKRRMWRVPCAQVATRRWRGCRIICAQAR